MSDNVSLYQFAADTTAEDADGNSFVIPAGTWPVRMLTEMTVPGRLDCQIDLGAAGGAHTMTRIALRELNLSGKASPVIPPDAKPIEKTFEPKRP